MKLCLKRNNMIFRDCRKVRVEVAIFMQMEKRKIRRTQKDLHGSYNQCNFELNHHTLCLPEEADRGRQGLFTVENQSPGNQKFTVFCICTDDPNRTKNIQMRSIHPLCVVVHLLLSQVRSIREFALREEAPKSGKDFSPM